jgi:hypothetical protein
MYRISYALGFWLFSTCSLSAMEQEQNHVAQVDESFNMKGLEEQLIVFEKEIRYDQWFTDRVIYADANAVTQNRFGFKHPQNYTLEKSEALQQAIALKSEEMNFSIENLKKTMHLESNEPKNKNNDQIYLFSANLPKKFMHYYNLVALLYLRKTILNESKKSLNNTLHNIDIIMLYIAHKKWQFFYPHFERSPNNEGAIINKTIPHVRDFQNCPEMLEHMITQLPKTFSDPSHFRLFYLTGYFEITPEEISKETQSIIKKFIETRSAQKQKELLNILEEQHGSEAPKNTCLIS